MSISEVFYRAATLIEKYGWVQQRSFDSFGRVDSRAAIYAAAHEDELPGPLWVMADHTIPLTEANPDAVDALAFFRAYLNKRGFRGTGITGWNDDPERNQAEVLAELRAAAKLAGAVELTPSQL